MIPLLMSLIFTCSPLIPLQQGSGFYRECVYVPGNAIDVHWERDTDGVWRVYYRLPKKAR